MPRHPYYNYDKLMSYNGTFNFLVGGRGLGKTYGAKQRVIIAAIKRGDQFIYLRRYTKELAKARNTFYADIAPAFPDWDFKIQGNEAQMAPASTRDEKKREWLTIGYFVALSTAQNEKSVSYPRVKTIIFDEFIIERGVLRYLNDEATIFTNFYSTVDRYTDKTTVFFLANSVSIMNPYFLEYNIRPDENSEFVKAFGGFVVCHFPDSENFNASIYNTAFGKFIKGTEYATYAVENSFSDNHEEMLAEKDYRAKYMFTLECKTGQFSVWYVSMEDEYFIQSKLPKSQITFTLESSRMTNDKKLLTFTDRPLAYLRTAFRSGRVSFDKPSTRNTFTEVFKR